jgi:hypothetical protein
MAIHNVAIVKPDEALIIVNLQLAIACAVLNLKHSTAQTIRSQDPLKQLNIESSNDCIEPFARLEILMSV